MSESTVSIVLPVTDRHLLEEAITYVNGQHSADYEIESFARNKESATLLVSRDKHEQEFLFEMGIRYAMLRHLEF